MPLAPRMAFLLEFAATASGCVCALAPSSHTTRYLLSPQLHPAAGDHKESPTVAGAEPNKGEIGPVHGMSHRGDA